MEDEYYSDDFYSQKVSDAYDIQYCESNDNLSEIDQDKNENNKNVDYRETTAIQGQVSEFNQIQESFTIAPGSPRVLGIEYTQGYLRTIIGRRVSVTFLLGTGSLTDRSGILTRVGISYIILRQSQTNTDVLCDIYSIKFVNIFD
ncbi:hypothetical protein CPAST_c32800 [Clostridium pasteurianum DSM 525 = ATCC 6013]|uniref:Uncharacterized protein n=1 Tax=Clostridium pasteurianum DSM 525 = ATCC 6013 TaxID=1262449 RepID=A0A0H3J5R3_CLOPA|nr:hypothetical protein [Clostridium pasteurianum]AJA49346.1 hypothetical protein CPAST_c32800 [Clostridium pasteurianum DSM 525 = ATCC 6013]AJA53334.1 hypothetical protein CLPA_c32800 [Clostridium pasteurianum DSM 525 = ATCC 6013]AOZ76520.1 hypothetical protein AQ983_15930 [Clostridium pasteurianum DSM 525 = ATCC 6013]AOZ80317.1 hypothetical protein AQ984_15925 [Clostridium pasteurianum]ELP58366.1 hypothetical protein F502_15405 [Clostridium pasteurianum DSM 525 = ATCC 6013]